MLHPARPALFGLTWSKLIRFLLPVTALAVFAHTLWGVWLGIRVDWQLARLELYELVDEPIEVVAARTELAEALALLVEYQWPESGPFGVPHMLVPEHAGDLEKGVAERCRFYAAIDGLPEALWQSDGAPLREQGSGPSPILFAHEATLALGARSWTLARVDGDSVRAGQDLARALALLRVIDDGSAVSNSVRRGLECSVLLVTERILDDKQIDPALLITALRPELERSLRVDHSSLMPQIELRKMISWQQLEPIERPSMLESWMARPFLLSSNLDLIALYECFQAGRVRPPSLSEYEGHVWTLWTKYPDQERAWRTQIAEQLAALRS